MAIGVQKELLEMMQENCVALQRIDGKIGELASSAGYYPELLAPDDTAAQFAKQMVELDEGSPLGGFDPNSTLEKYGVITEILLQPSFSSLSRVHSPAPSSHYAERTHSVATPVTGMRSVSVPGEGSGQSTSAHRQTESPPSPSPGCRASTPPPMRAGRRRELKMEHRFDSSVNSSTVQPTPGTERGGNGGGPAHQTASQLIRGLSSVTTSRPVAVSMAAHSSPLWGTSSTNAHGRTQQPETPGEQTHTEAVQRGNAQRTGSGDVTAARQDGGVAQPQVRPQAPCAKNDRLRMAFEKYDHVGEGHMDAEDVRTVLGDLGYEDDSQYAQDVLAQFGRLDHNGNGTISTHPYRPTASQWIIQCG